MFSAFSQVRLCMVLLMQHVRDPGDCLSAVRAL
jgi:hypothetical protein